MYEKSVSRIQIACTQIIINENNIVGQQLRKRTAVYISCNEFFWLESELVDVAVINSSARHCPCHIMVTRKGFN